MNLLLTGATGVLGAELVQTLANRRQDGRIFVLLRAATTDEWRVRADALVAPLDPDEKRRVIPVSGDVTFEDLGLGRRYREIAGQVDEIFHAAACTRFDVSPEYATTHNVSGTKNVLSLARAATEAGRSGRVHYVSTAFVSGQRTGQVTESEFDCGQRFFNAYESSKFQAEQAVRDAGRDLPVTIYRPSVVVGHSRTGRAHRFLGVYQVLRWIDRGQVATLPCRGDFLLDLAPADYVAEAITRLAELPESVGQTFHLTAGPHNALSIEELIGIFLKERDIPGKPQPRRLQRVHFETGDSGGRARRLAPYVPYLTCAKAFDDRNTRAMLTGFGAPPCRDFFPNVARYALETGFRPA